MIIQIRGTSGAGKTTVMRAVMAELLKVSYIRHGFIEGRRNPLYIEFSGAALGIVSVIGSYNSTCGGVDTIHGYSQLQATVAERLKNGHHVLMEGLLLSEDTKQTLLMKGLEDDLRVIFLATPLDVCLDRVRGRRAARGNDKPLNEKNTTNRVETIRRAREKLEEAGVRCVGNSCEQAPGTVLRWLKEAR